MKKFIALFVSLLTVSALADFRGYMNTTNLGVFGAVKCSAGLTCTKVGDQLQIVSNPSIGIGGVINTHYVAWAPPSLSGAGTDVNGTSGTVYLSETNIMANAQLTGIGLLNGVVSGATSYIVALFNSAGALLAHSIVAGTPSSGSNSWQQIPFTATYQATGPQTYWIGLYANNGTDSFQAIPAVGRYMGFAGSESSPIVSGVISNITPLGTFTPDLGPVVYTY